MGLTDLVNVAQKLTTHVYYCFIQEVNQSSIKRYTYLCVMVLCIRVSNSKETKPVASLLAEDISSN